MIYYPKKYELYAKSLRCLYQKFILQKGFKPNFLNSLRKIYEFECIFQTHKTPVDLYDFCEAILTAVSLKRNLIFHLSIHGKYFLNQKTFIAVLLGISITADYIHISTKDEILTIKSNFKKTKTLERLIKILGGVLLKNSDNGVSYIFIKLEKTKKETVDFQDAYELSVNPLSIVNCYLI